jgi:hypothetical protein
LEITVKLPDEIGKQLNNIPNFDEFVAKVVKEALESRPAQATSSDSGLSKWARISQRVRSNPVRLGEYTHQLKKDMKEFRENFEFRHGEKF